tara:strand:+ start:347 stop:502 length:156 start_codon:yes stop_codon:yes gene_type:complete
MKNSNVLATVTFGAKELQELTGIAPAINEDGSTMTFEEFKAREKAKREAQE